ncbi:hypothetical protein FD755_015661 [Muntiacus reevesi]|uniref:ubiquitinyl hydrolase 1 n=1 Tax=Muntiacus reevesi TaxID=9886 RepID=A0A5N3XFL9_MUNRE|nr:hypothetical protein FD755_015661 [Muntiacus reevesi]
MDREAWRAAIHRYIFGDFSPDEFNQFSVTPHASVELPPHGGTVLCGAQASSDLPDGHNFQRIEYVVNEVIEPSDTLPRMPNYSISSTLNPQAPEFVLSCTTSKNLPDDTDKEVNCSSADCQYSGPTLALDGSSHAEVEVIENDGVSGGLGKFMQKEEKHPPGYYSHLKVPSAALQQKPWSVVIQASSPQQCRRPGCRRDGGCPNSPPLSDLGQPSGHHRLCQRRRTALRLSQSPGRWGQDCRAAKGCPRADSQQGHPVEDSYGSALRNSCQQGGVAHCGELGPGPAKAESTPPPVDAPASAAGTVPTSQPAKSWASLFHDSKPSSSCSPVASVETKNSPPTTSPLVSEKQAEVKEGLVPVSEDPEAIKIAELLGNTSLIHKPVLLQPCGLIYKGNWCYIKATLQALVACPPMHHLMNPCTSTPMTDTLGDKIMRDIRPRAAFEPTYICRLLTMIKWSLSEKDGQKDAETYLGFILNRLQEEMLNRKKLLSPDNENLTVSSGPKSHSVNEEEQEELGEGSEDEWEQVGHRNKTSVTHQAAFVQTPIAGIFGGHINIQSDKICTAQGVLGSLVARESVEISGRVTLEKLPPGLLLRLQWFVLLSPGVNNKNFKCHRAYRLFTDVSQVRLKGWRRAEEQTVTVISLMVKAKAKASSKSEAHRGARSPPPARPHRGPAEAVPRPLLGSALTASPLLFSGS